MMKVAVPLALATAMTVGISHAVVPLVVVDIAPVHSLVTQVMGGGAWTINASDLSKGFPAQLFASTFRGSSAARCGYRFPG